MKLEKFIDCRFQELSLEGVTLAKDKKRAAYSLARDAETGALNFVLSFYRSFVKWILVPKVLFGFILVALHLKSEPQPVVTQMIEKDEAFKAAEKQKDLDQKAKKIGFGKPQIVDSVSNEQVLPN